MDGFVTSRCTANIVLVRFLFLFLCHILLVPHALLLLATPHTSTLRFVYVDDSAYEYMCVCVSFVSLAVSLIGLAYTPCKAKQ